MTIATDVWHAYVVNHIMEKSIALGKEHCQGCQLKWKSGFLHVHEQSPLLYKLETHLDTIRTTLLAGGLESLYNVFTKNETLALAKEEVLEQTRTLISHATARSLYYGRWVTVEHDIIFESMFMKRKRNRKVEKRSANFKPRRKRLFVDTDVQAKQYASQAVTLEDIFNEYDSSIKSRGQ